jgi:RNA polymerase sigma-70 factor (ECF subfamily)
MEREDLRLSRIDTVWSIVRKAHDDCGQEARSAQRLLIDRYGGAIRRYLLGALRDQDAAEELFQQFSLNLVRGGFGRADPAHGRFRNFVKTSLFHLIVDYQRQRRRGGLQPATASGTFDPADSQVSPSQLGSLAEEEAAFARSWREELLARAWEGLAELEESAGTPYYTVLRFRFDHPEMHSPEMATHLSTRLGKRVSATSVRVLLHRARETFAELLLDAVLGSLEDPSSDEAEEELIDLGLLDYCRSTLRRRREKGQEPCNAQDKQEGVAEE